MNKIEIAVKKVLYNKNSNKKCKTANGSALTQRNKTMAKVKSIFPANDFKVVADNASKEIEVGIVIGYDKEGELCVFGGGLLDHRQPVAKDWLWMVEAFKLKLIDGDYSED